MHSLTMRSFWIGLGLLLAIGAAGRSEAQADGSPPATPPDGIPLSFSPDWFPVSALLAVDPFAADSLPLAEVLHTLATRSGFAVELDGVPHRFVSVEIPAGSGVDALLHVARQEALAVHPAIGGVRLAPLAASADPEPSDAPLAPPPLSPAPFEASVVSPGFSGIHVHTAPDGALLTTLQVDGIPLTDVLRDLAQQASLALLVQTPTTSQVTARWEGLPLDDALRVLLLGTTLTYRREGAALVVAERALPGMTTSRLVRLSHVPAGGIVERLPESLRREATHQLIQEQNALVVTGPADIVAATVAFVREIDQPPAQILLEVLVVEFETSGLRQAGVSFLGGLLPDDPSAPALSEPGRAAYVFGGGDDQRGGLDLVGDATTGNRMLNFWSDVLGIRSIGRLPTDFYFRLQALERAGRAEVRSRPHIATLNGNTATISVGTSQYYILRSSYGYGDPGAFGSGADSERFEYVRADVRLEITPWVSETGDVTAVIRPAFATPVGAFDPRVPPTINSWSVDTSVRLRNGETFMIGGLVQQHERRVENRIPLLGRLPLIGRLFRNTTNERRSSELVIFITPHVLTSGPATPEMLGTTPP